MHSTQRCKQHASCVNTMPPTSQCVKVKGSRTSTWTLYISRIDSRIDKVDNLILVVVLVIDPPGRKKTASFLLPVSTHAHISFIHSHFTITIQLKISCTRRLLQQNSQKIHINIEPAAYSHAPFHYPPHTCIFHECAIVSYTSNFRIGQPLHIEKAFGLLSWCSLCWTPR